MYNSHLGLQLIARAGAQHDDRTRSRARADLLRVRMRAHRVRRVHRANGIKFRTETGRAQTHTHESRF